MSDIVAGFTGTSDGMTHNQKKSITEFMQHFMPKHVRHGDCMGADEEFHNICLNLGIPIYIHPPRNPKKRAWCEGWVMIFNPEEYLDRNRHIVDGCGVLLAAPKSLTEELRSGTWSTLRYAQRVGRICHIFWPDGSIMLDWKR